MYAKGEAKGASKKKLALNQTDKTVKLQTTTNQTEYNNPESHQTADSNKSALEYVVKFCL